MQDCRHIRLLIDRPICIAYSRTKVLLHNGDTKITVCHWHWAAQRDRHDNAEQISRICCGFHRLQAVKPLI